MGPQNNNSRANHNISLENKNQGEWDNQNLDEILLKEEIECDDVTIELNEDEIKPLVINFQTNCDAVLNNTPSEPSSKLTAALLENNQRCSIEQRPTVVNSIKKQQNTESEKKICQTKLGTCEKLFVNLQRGNLEKLQKQKQRDEKQSASDPSKSQLKKVFERRLDVVSGKLVFQCLCCEFQSITLENMIKHISNNTHKTESKMVQPQTHEEIKTQKRICGLCLEACDNFKAIEGDMNHILDTVLPNIDSTVIQGRVVCTHCTEMLMKCFDFKEACLYTYNNIISFANNRDNDKLNLKDIYLSKNQNCAGIPEDEVICGFCMGSVKNCSAISLDVEEGDIMLQIMMAQCLPELDLSLIEKPVVCTSCHDSLESCFGFMTNCLTVEEKVQKYCENLNGNNSSQTELSSPLQFNAGNEVNGNSVDIIKEEKSSCEENEMATEEDSKKLEEIYLKEENFFKIENEQIDIKTNEQEFNRFEGVASPQSEDTNGLNRKKVTKHRCDSCSYQGKRKYDLQMHQLVHKKTSEVTMYKCDSCSYQTKYKSALPIHLLKHKNPSEITMYRCAACSYQTKYKQNLKIHLLQHRSPSETTTYKCDFRKHVQMHKGPSEVPFYKCDSCLFQTRFKSVLRYHMRVHKCPSEVTMYKCDACSYQTKYKQNLKIHLPLHSNPSEVTMYKCYSCSYQTRNKSHLRAHIPLHNKRQSTICICKFCSFRTINRSHFMRHVCTSSSETN